ncbi:MAG: translation initiation factor IF-2 N-terminal domain-containing protein, partial [Gemmatimonadaceae bacterium]|nr:translation initiation factor IF-2 N-terminal domain-containing protein [Gemmatimonadaceae bacterium]
MSKLLVNDMAGEFGISVDEVLNLLRQMDVSVRSHMTPLSDDQVARVRAKWEREKRARATAPAAALTRRRRGAAVPVEAPAPAAGAASEAPTPARRRRRAAEAPPVDVEAEAPTLSAVADVSVLDTPAPVAPARRATPKAEPDADADAVSISPPPEGKAVPAHRPPDRNETVGAPAGPARATPAPVPVPAAAPFASSSPSAPVSPSIPPMRPRPIVPGAPRPRPVATGTPFAPPRPVASAAPGAATGFPGARRDDRPRPGDDRGGRRGKKGKRGSVDQEAVSSSISKTMTALRQGVVRRGGARRADDASYREEMEAQRVAAVEREKKTVHVNEFITVSELAAILKIPATQIVGFAFKNLGLMVTINQRLDFDQIELIAGEFGFQAVKEEEYTAGLEESAVTDTPEQLEPRPPVVTIMGHVD